MPKISKQSVKDEDKRIRDYILAAGLPASLETYRYIQGCMLYSGMTLEQSIYNLLGTTPDEQFYKQLKDLK